MKNVLSVMFAMVLASSVGADELCREGATLTYTMVDAYQRGVAQERMLAVFDNGTLPPALAEEFKTAVRELYLSGLP